MIKLTQASSMNAARNDLDSLSKHYLFLAPDAIESVATNPNYGMSSRAAATVIRMKVTGAIHYVDESAEKIAEQIRAYTCIKA